MQLELPVRWDESAHEINEIDQLKGTDKQKYTYGRLLIDSGDIGPYYDIDDNHTMINDMLGKIYCVRIPINQLKMILTEVTGKAIMKIEEKTIAPPTRRRPSKNDDDDILK